MKSLLGCLFALTFIATSANASVVNSRFEDPLNLTNGEFASTGGLGAFELAAIGYSLGGNGAAGTYAANFDLLYSGLDPETRNLVGSRVGFANAGASLSQVTDTLITSSASIAVSFLLGSRSDILPSSGSFSFFAGDDPTNVIQTFSLDEIAAGNFTSVDLMLTASLDDFIGQTLGFTFTGLVGQINFDAVELIIDLDAANATVPLPAGFLLFLSGLGGLLVSRRKA